MKLIQGNEEVLVNTRSNWPLITDLFYKWGYGEIDPEAEIPVVNLNDVLLELSAWGIPWKRTYGE